MRVIDHIRGQLVSIETNLILPKCDKDSNSYSIQHRNSEKRKSVELEDFPLCPGQTFILFLGNCLRFACVINLPSFSALTNLKRQKKGRGEGRSGDKAG